MKFIRDGVERAERYNPPGLSPAPTPIAQLHSARDSSSAPRERGKHCINADVCSFADEGLEETDGFITDLWIEPAQNRSNDARGALRRAQIGGADEDDRHPQGDWQVSFEQSREHGVAQAFRWVRSFSRARER